MTRHVSRPPTISSKSLSRSRGVGTNQVDLIDPAIDRGAAGLDSFSDHDESIENEISKLTWAVLDGCATNEQRKRLSELVSTQHKRRQLPAK